MRKKLVSLLAAVLTMGMLAGCGNADVDADKPMKDMEVDNYVTLGEYKGLEVTVDPIVVADAEVTSLVNDMYANSMTIEKGGITDRAVAVGDTVNIDYVGKKDGVAFEGGTAPDAILTIGSGRFIDGFEDGLVGVMPGETVDLNLTFPENYGSADLAGQDVVFTVTVNFIVPTEMKDEVIASMGIANVSTIDELRQYAYNYLYSNAQENYNIRLENSVIQAFMENCTFKEIPTEIVEKYEAEMTKNVTASAESMGVDADTFTNYYYRMNLETFVDTYAENAVKQDIAMQAVANRENLNISDEELDNTLTEYAQMAGYSTVEEYLGDTPKEDFREYFMYTKVTEYLINNAKVSSTAE